MIHVKLVAALGLCVGMGVGVPGVVAEPLMMHETDKAGRSVNSIACPLRG
jgi:hypothetical protein